MKKQILVIASVAVLVVAATVFALAQGHPDGQKEKMRGPGGPEQMIEHLSRELNLTDAQKEQAKALFEAQRGIEEERHAKLEAIHKQIEEATANGQFDEATVRPLASQQAQLMTEEMIDHLRLHSKLFALLTTEQKAKASEMMKRHGGPGGPGGPGRHHGPPPPPPGF
ncbi:MAG TPA: Spy/CpxP family protein refolding chaperone [Pyrinomonadaceae bacterium]|nr:Spy/CpxP family protein refolding chaperone [Pyrinomonadaceae bacterium]